MPVLTPDSTIEADFISEVAEELIGYHEANFLKRKQMERRALSLVQGGTMKGIVREFIGKVKEGYVSVEFDPDDTRHVVAETMVRSYMAICLAKIHSGDAPSPDGLFFAFDDYERGMYHTPLVGDSQHKEAQVLGLSTTWPLKQWGEIVAAMLVTTNAEITIGMPDGAAFHGEIAFHYGWREEDTGEIKIRRITRDIHVDGERSKFGDIDVEGSPTGRAARLLEATFTLNKVARELPH